MFRKQSGNRFVIPQNCVVRQSVITCDLQTWAKLWQWIDTSAMAIRHWLLALDFNSKGKLLVIILLFTHCITAYSKWQQQNNNTCYNECQLNSCSERHFALLLAHWMSGTQTPTISISTFTVIKVRLYNCACIYVCV